MASEAIGAEDGILGASVSLVGAEGGDLGGSDDIQRLRVQKILLNQQRKLLSKQLRNEQRKRQRLRERAKKLSNADLVRVLTDREAMARAKAKPQAKSRLSAGRP